MRVHALQADITTLPYDAIVNAANSTLMGGGGVDGAIHRAAGWELADECRLLNGCEVGQAKLTRGYRLPARYVVHTVGPYWRGGAMREPELLASCYRESLKIAAEHAVKTIAFPSISTGIFGYPIEEAAVIAVQTVRAHAPALGFETVAFCCFSERDLAVYLRALAAPEPPRLTIPPC
jgi:O-acetyl-ADP-ribose deacetylase